MPGNRESVAIAAGPASAAQPAPPPGLTYADLADLADGTPVVLRAKPRGATRVEAERAPGLRPGHARLYIEARTVALIAGPDQAGDSLRYLIDVPLDAKGKLPKRAKGDVVLFARTNPARPGELQLVAPDGEVAWSAELETRLKGVLAALLAPDAPPRIGGVREAIHVSGTLAGEGETQLFLATADGEPASISVVRRPGASPRWSVSFSEVLDARGEPPAPETLEWYRLACFLPPRLPAQAHVSASAADRTQAEADYRLVLAALGPCPRSRG
ncbi:hypothetical protein H7F53_12180 [Novosphingobium piscinae]|uniref:Uncharacterized protein n=1 Tax=Novosphingobium piscinae TaxID=1507448 RepID=A0A7X1FZL0_9SPHN|nr:hypothetical protein [Novosphingobium piscinae]